MSTLGWFIAAAVCLLCLLSQRAAAASLSALSALSHSGHKHSGGSALSAKAGGSGCAVCGFRLCKCLTRPAAAFRSVVSAAPYIALRAGAGFLEGGLMGLAGSALLNPFTPASVHQMKETAMTVAKFGAARRGGSALLEAIRDKDDEWNDVAANALAGGYLLAPTEKIRDRCLTGAACGGLTLLAKRVRSPQRLSPLLERPLDDDSSWNQEEYSW